MGFGFVSVLLGLVCWLFYCRWFFMVFVVVVGLFFAFCF